MGYSNREPQMNVRVYLSVPFCDKDEAKYLGCRWDSNFKKWFCIDSDYGKSNVSKCIERWNNPEPYKIIDGKKISLYMISKYNRGFTR
jgi:hypothetical protein|tara:strand:- start:379 stop:642 length:264 start_codon:yes stop_codon:yes gene_type:complete